MEATGTFAENTGGIRSNATLICRKQHTSGRLEIYDHLSEIVDRCIEMSRKTVYAKKSLNGAVYDFFIQTDLVPRDFFFAFITMHRRYAGRQTREC